MNTTGLTLLIPERVDSERDAVAQVWRDGGGGVLRLGRFWDPPPVDPAATRLYGNDAFCLVLEQKLGLALLSPDDQLLLTLAPRYLGREVVSLDGAALSALKFPVFVKSVIPKQIRSRVYHSGEALAMECQGLEQETRYLASPPVTFVAEARCFLLEGRVLDAAIYEGRGDPAEAAAFAARVAEGDGLPAAVVMDVGLLEGAGWVVVEFNAAWGAGLNGCDPARVLPAIAAATRVRT
jgi:hypothetical protein